MRSVIYCADKETVTAASVACSVASIAVEVAPSLQELGAQLYRDKDAVGVFWSAGWSSAVEACRGFREASVTNPLLVILPAAVSPARAVQEVVFTLGAGADDCQHEPIDGHEIAARILALYRRKREHAPKQVELPGGAIYWPEKSVIENAGRIVSLTGQENRLFDLLTSRPGICVSRPMCMLALYDHEGDAHPKIIDVFVCKLRKKLAPLLGGAECLETIWGVGWRFRPEGVEPGASVAALVAGVRA